MTEYRTLTAEDIGHPEEVEGGCLWCGMDAGGPWFWIRTGDVICVDCRALVAVLDEGPLVLEHLTYEGRTFVLTPPLALTLCIEYDPDEGNVWLKGKPSAEDEERADRLWLTDNDDTPGVSAQSRQGLVDAAAEAIIGSYLDWSRDAVNPAMDVEDRAMYQRHIDEAAPLLREVLPV